MQLVAWKLSTNGAKNLIILGTSNSDANNWYDLGNHESVISKFIGWSLSCFAIVTLQLLLTLDEEDVSTTSSNNTFSIIPCNKEEKFHKNLNLCH